jgi:hypothetical protein
MVTVQTLNNLIATYPAGNQGEADALRHAREFSRQNPEVNTYVRLSGRIIYAAFRNGRLCA